MCKHTETKKDVFSKVAVRRYLRFSDPITVLGMFTFKVECRRYILLKIQTIKRLEINFIKSIYPEKQKTKKPAVNRRQKLQEFHMKDFIVDSETGE